VISIKTLFDACEEDLRMGRTSQCARRLGELKRVKVPREWIGKFAGLCRRAGQTEMGLRLLTRIVRSETEAVTATPDELAEYGALLLRSGATDEARKVLAGIDVSHTPDAGLFRAFCDFDQWRYVSAIPLLQAYLRAPISNYSQLVGKVNLAFALIAIDRLDEASELLQDGIATARKGKFTRLLGNCLEMQGQIDILRGRYARAEKSLDAAAEALSEARTLDELYLRKWRAILTASRHGETEELISFRAEAVARNHAESVRQTDLVVLKVAFDQNLFDRLYAGTPYAQFRMKLTAMFPQARLPENFLWGDPGGAILDLGRTNRDIARHQAFLRAILHDFYRPPRVGGLFASLFPNDYFDVYSSPNRIHQCLRRARQWLMGQNLPLSIDARSRVYSLSCKSPCQVRVSAAPVSNETHDALLADLRRDFADSGGFCAKSAQARLGISASSFHRLARRAIEERKMMKFGASTSTVYYFAD
jgi:tetratricopeptide (TPR) repeat protein